MAKKDLSIIIPFVGEYPQVLFTIQSIAQTIGTNLNFEIIAVDNYCEEVESQAFQSMKHSCMDFIGKYKKTDNIFDDMIQFHKSIMNTYENKSGEAVKACAKGNEWLKYISYTDRLSHWQAKRVGIENAESDTFLTIDAHCVPSFHGITNMWRTYNRPINSVIEHVRTDGATRYADIGTLHMPLTYKILEWHRLIYKLHIENNYFFSYKFTPFREDKFPYEVPCMSTCGMMISRKIYESIGGWPTGLGIYGGGENYMNYVLAVCGYKKFIYPQAILFHHGEKRDYHYVYDNFLKNRMIAHYLIGGKFLLDKFVSISKGNPEVSERLSKEVVKEHRDHRELIMNCKLERNVYDLTIFDWAKKWTEE